jgi:hypothetical protein
LTLSSLFILTQGNKNDLLGFIDGISVSPHPHYLVLSFNTLAITLTLNALLTVEINDIILFSQPQWTVFLIPIN